MKIRSSLFSVSLLLAVPLFAAEKSGDYVESFDTTYNSLTVERRGTVVELRARSRRGEYVESAVDLSDPLKQVVAYTRTLYAGLFFQPKPERVLMIGLGGAGFHRLFTSAYPQTLLQTVELDPKVLELTQSRLGFQPTDKTPVAVLDGRLYVKRSQQKWDWLILDAFRGRMRARKVVVQAILAQGLAVELIGPVAGFVAAHPSAAMPHLSREQAFVLSRALMGAIRAAVMEEQPFLRGAAFEDELVRLAVAYLSALTAPSAAAR